MSVRIMVGHVLDRMAELPDESVHCCVTSPPYYGLRDYGIEPQVWLPRHKRISIMPGGDCQDGHQWGEIERTKKGDRKPKEGIESNNKLGASEYAQSGAPLNGGNFCLRCNAWRGSLGLEPTPALYIEHMVAVFREARRVLRKDGVMFLNIGDSYAGGGQGNYGQKIAAQHGQYQTNVKNRPDWLSAAGVKAKDLLGIPWALAFALRDDGWWLRSEITWAKRAPMPESCTDRPTSATEKVFLLTKSGSPTYWTHRDHEGSRTKPAPDYRWVDHDNDDQETGVEPENWRTEPAANVSRLGGRGEQSTTANLPNATLRDHSGGVSVTPVQHRKRWSRINLWAAHDYFYDQIAIQEDSESDHPSGNGYDRPEQLSRGGRGQKGQWANVGGKRNLRNFLLLGPAPFAEAHFATFVPRIPEIAILAGTSARGVCQKCGAGWVRITKSKTETHRTPGEFQTGRIGGDSVETKGRAGDVETETIGWRPTCKCEAGDPVHATCLDPFLGAGTTALVADRLGRNCIGIELSPAYAEMAEKRLRDDAAMFTEVAVE